MAKKNFEIRAQGVSPDEAKRLAFAKFNNGPHLLVDVPMGESTISVRTPTGELLTFAFVPYEEDGTPRCVDIVHHTNGTGTINGSRNVPTFNAALRYPGNVIASGVANDTKKPLTLISVSLPSVGFAEATRRLVESGTVEITLDGLPAKVCGYADDFATITHLDAPRASAEYPWETVLNKLHQRHGNFTTD